MNKNPSSAMPEAVTTELQASDPTRTIPTHFLLVKNFIILILAATFALAFGSSLRAANLAALVMPLDDEELEDPIPRSPTP